MIREYLGDINFFLEQKNAMNMHEIEKKMLWLIPNSKNGKEYFLTKIKKKAKFSKIN